jgi:hypothetical protein
MHGRYIFYAHNEITGTLLKTWPFKCVQYNVQRQAEQADRGPCLPKEEHDRRPIESIQLARIVRPLLHLQYNAEHKSTSHSTYSTPLRGMCHGPRTYICNYVRQSVAERDAFFREDPR